MADNHQRKIAHPAADVQCWLEQDSSVMLRAATASGDPVELTADETKAIAAELLAFAKRLDSEAARDI